MATIKRYSIDTKDYVIVFFLADGRKYYIGENYLFLSIKDNMEYEVFEKNVRKYTRQGSKMITTKIWKEFGSINENKNGSYIVRSLSYPLESFKKEYVYNLNGKNILNL